MRARIRKAKRETTMVLFGARWSRHRVAHHPAEYFAESILNPNRVILQGTGYTGSDGLSKMPEYADTMTLRQLVDVVTYLKSLGGGDMRHDGHEMGGPMKMK